jgi:uncharacterized SAM-binding protein YcdF (DUF218 family)
LARRALRFTLLAAAAALVAAATHTLWLSAVGNWLVVSEEPFAADAVVVLAGDRFGHRILKGAELVRQGFAPAAYVSGPCDYYGACECDAAIDFAVKHGHPRTSFVRVPHSALSTREEAEVFARELRGRGCKRYILVTSDYHTRRACGLFRQQAPDLEMRCVAAGDRFFRAGSWWKQRESRKAVFLEFTKTIAVRLGL